MCIYMYMYMYVHIHVCMYMYMYLYWVTSFQHLGLCDIWLFAAKGVVWCTINALRVNTCILL